MSEKKKETTREVVCRLKSKLRRLTAGIEGRIYILEKDKERTFKSVGELIVKSDDYHELPSIITVAIDDAQRNVRDIDREIATLNWVMLELKK